MNKNNCTLWFEVYPNQAECPLNANKICLISISKTLHIACLENRLALIFQLKTTKRGRGEKFNKMEKFINKNI